MNVFLPTCVYVHPMHADALRDQKRVSSYLELELWMVVDHYMCNGNKPRVCCKGNKCS